MDLQTNILSIIGKQESNTLEYKAVLPPSKLIAKIICSFANTDGGYLILGVTEIGGIKAVGLSGDFRATSMTHKAIDMLVPKPNVNYGFVECEGRQLFAIQVEKSSAEISVNGEVYERIGDQSKLRNPATISFRQGGYARISSLNSSLESKKNHSTNSKNKVIVHYQSILKIIDGLKVLLYPQSHNTVTNNSEGKILSRIMFSSIVDNFETYLSDLLFEIYLAKPDTLKSDQQVKVSDVLNCNDIQDFVEFFAKQKISKLQKGSVKGFIKDNKQIKDLNIMDDAKIDEIEKILQIRHLYSHRNGIADEKFIQYYKQGVQIGDDFLLTIDEILEKLEYLASSIVDIDSAAITKYNLSTI